VIGKFRCKQNSRVEKYLHTYYWPTRRSKTIRPKAFRYSISGMLSSLVSLFWSHDSARIQFH